MGTGKPDRLLRPVLLASMLWSTAFAQAPQIRQQGQTNQGAGVNTGVMNQGTCNVTVLNARASSLKVVGCNLDGGSADQEAKSLKELLLRAKQNQISLAQIEVLLDKLIKESKLPPIQQSVEEGVANTGNISAPLTFNDNRQYGASAPPPPVIQVDAEPLKAVLVPIAGPEDASRFGLIGEEESPYTRYPGYQLTITVGRTFVAPEFLIRCDNPCIGTAAYQDSGSEYHTIEIGRGSASNSFTRAQGHPEVILLRVASPAVMTQGTYLTIKLRSPTSTPIKATITSYAEPLPR